MLELLEKVELLKRELDQLEIWKHLAQARDCIYQNHELVDKIKMYEKSPNPKLRLEIYHYNEIIKYKRLENEVNFMIMEINHKLNVSLGVRSCQNENR